MKQKPVPIPQLPAGNDGSKEEPLGKTGSGWEKRIVPLIVELLADREYAHELRLIWPIEGARQASENHRSMAWAADLLWSVRYGTDEDKARARATVMQYFKLELQFVGLWRHEQLCCNPHGGFHMDSMLLIRMAAHESEDAELLALSDAQFLRLGAICTICSTPAGDVWVPCKRGRPSAAVAKGQARPPLSSHLTAWWRFVKGLPQLGGVGKGGRIDEQFWAPAKATRLLIDRYHDDFGGAAKAQPIKDLPLLNSRMEFRRWTQGGGDGTSKWVGGFFARFMEEPNGGSDGTCSWVLCDYAKMSGQQGDGLEFGFGFGDKLTAPIPWDRIPSGASFTTPKSSSHPQGEAAP